MEICQVSQDVTLTTSLLYTREKERERKFGVARINPVVDTLITGKLGKIREKFGDEPGRHL